MSKLEQPIKGDKHAVGKYGVLSEEPKQKACYCACHAKDNFGWDQKTTTCEHCNPAPSLNTWEDLNKLLAVFLGKHVANLGGLSYLAFEKESIQPIQDYIDSQITLAMQKERERIRKEVEDATIFGKLEDKNGFPWKLIKRADVLAIVNKGVEEK